ncbi:hypothetical protein TNCV_4555811 [Trichonephila clavipes]|nr:hypothetical protein TNCV_4555811 [Trichonephila clavipes]
MSGSRTPVHIFDAHTVNSKRYRDEILEACFHDRGCDSPVVKVSDHGRNVMCSSPIPLKACRVRCKLNLSRAEVSSH